MCFIRKEKSKFCISYKKEVENRSRVTLGREPLVSQGLNIKYIATSHFQPIGWRGSPILATLSQEGSPATRRIWWLVEKDAPGSPAHLVAWRGVPWGALCQYWAPSLGEEGGLLPVDWVLETVLVLGNSPKNCMLYLVTIKNIFLGRK